ncbi:MAG: winged helix-turn-helix domain-containing protein [Candidatus Hadarchaeota archaeon]
MATKSGRLVYPVDLTERADDLKAIAEKLRISKAEAVREAIKNYAEYIRGLEVVAYRQVSKAQARKEVQSYLRGKERVWADEISNALQIDLGLVNEVLLEMWKEGWVEPNR